MKKRNKKKRDKKNKKKVFFYMFLRYFILVLAGVFFPFYKIFLPLTIWPVYFFLKAFYDVSIVGRIISASVANIEIINACVAGSAYYLLLILNLATPMKVRQRIYSLLFSFLSLLVLNILRIFLLSVLLLENSAFFDITHKLFLYALSIVFVIGIWFLTVWIFKIKAIPAYSDIKTFYK